MAVTRIRIQMNEESQLLVTDEPVEVQHISGTLLIVFKGINEGKTERCHWLDFGNTGSHQLCTEVSRTWHEVKWKP